MQVDNQTNTNLHNLSPLSSGRALILFNALSELVPVGDVQIKQRPQGPTATSSNPFADIVNVRSVSPREMSEFSLELYAMGVISFDDYSALAYHPELHPDFDNTIGALTGEAAAPERKRDLIVEWEDKNSFLKRHSPINTNLIDQSNRITDVLKSLAHPTTINA